MSKKEKNRERINWYRQHGICYSAGEHGESVYQAETDQEGRTERMKRQSGMKSSGS